MVVVFPMVVVLLFIPLGYVMGQSHIFKVTVLVKICLGHSFLLRLLIRIKIHKIIVICGLIPYTFYKPTMGPKYFSNGPYNKFITPTTFIQSIISIFNGFPLLCFDVGYTIDS